MSVFVKSTLCRNIQLPISDIGDDEELVDKFKTILSSELQGKCTVEGYLKKNSIIIHKYSIGILKGHQVCFNVEFFADMVYPIKDQLLKCVVIGPNHFGLKCRLKDDDDCNSCDVYIPRDHHHPLARLNKHSTDTDIEVKVIGVRFEVNDPQITVIASIHDEAKESFDVGEALWTVEYLDEIHLKTVQDNPEKTFVVDSSLVSKKELAAFRKLANARILDVSSFGSFHSNKDIIQPFINSLHDAKTLVFPLKFADSVRHSAETYHYLKTKLAELGFQPVMEQPQSGGGKKKEEMLEFGDY